jgi:predicted transposase YbfD/YdcC
MNQEHLFFDILVITICAVICGADDWVAVERFGQAKAEWFATFLELPNGIPSHDTFWRVFRLLDSEQFQKCFLAWMEAVSQRTAGEVVAVDGKKLRHSFAKEDNKAAIHMVSAWATANGLVLGQRKVDDKSNEITAIPALLRTLALSGCIVTTDAMGCQVEIAQVIIDQEADYVLALKENQANLYADVALLFDDLEESGFAAYPYDHAQTVDKGHGRIEVRKAWTISDPALIAPLRGADRWPQLRSLVKVQAERYLPDKHTVEVRYFLSSLTDSAAALLQVVRTHWSIENSCHWVLDIAFREDEARLRKDQGAQNFAVLRHIALNALKQEASAKVGVKNKRLLAGWDHDYLMRVLSTLFC